MKNERRGFSYGRVGFRLRSSNPREIHKTTCVDCGQETEVPFQLYGSRPVYCRECYQNHIPKRY